MNSTLFEPLYEQCRPQTLDEFIGQDEIVAKLRDMENKTGFGRRALWFSGKSGTGKTSFARCVARCIADPLSIYEYDAGELTVDTIDKIKRHYECTALDLLGSGKHGKAFIIDEAHGLRKEPLRRLLKILEPIPAHCVWCFTTTNEGQEKLFEDYDDAGPLLSRCYPFKLSEKPGAQKCATKLLEVARSHNLDGKPLKAYVELWNQNRGNWRACYQQIENGIMAV